MTDIEQTVSVKSWPIARVVTKPSRLRELTNGSVWVLPIGEWESVAVRSLVETLRTTARRQGKKLETQRAGPMLLVRAI